MSVYQIDEGPRAGRYIRARWDEQRGQYTSSDIRSDAATQGYQYSYARTLHGLAAVGVRTYATIEAARQVQS